MEVYVLNVLPLRDRMEEALSCLTPDRRERALRLRRELPRLQSIAAGLLLGRFFPGAEMKTAPEGRPYVPNGRHFSLSHSGELAVLAVSDEPVGIDVERIAHLRERLWERVLTPEELSWLQTAPADGFFRLWTRKEAALKCLGTGIDRDLRSVCVLGDTVELDGTALLLHTVSLENAVLSAASAGRSAVFSPTAITADELLKGGKR